MEKKEETVALVAGSASAVTRDICRSLAKKGISAIVVQKEGDRSEADDSPRQWSGRPGEDLFFNGWKLLF